ncbi:sugar transferase [Flavobacterium zepuense]|uniref:Sugar transferase n=1 Tax=Flavobacterium zepuense TaxID=2593302 RepID=A0A552V2E5_9FLAO|nr:sugar transferase [Flavobacterium zepuense]TRW24646.1 sugar transferase [Flavobacterium zepuense]
MIKRLFDITVSFTALIFLGWLIVVLFIVASISTGQNGLFIQKRIGRYGRPFSIFKVRSMKDTANGKQVTSFGRFLRKYKLDELPQLFNVLFGTMSFVGPRPDLPGYYDQLTGTDRDVLTLRPGITGPASIKYANEEAILAAVTNPEIYNDTVIFPDKVRINKNYLVHQSLFLDIKIMFYTVLGKKLEEDYFN